MPNYSVYIHAIAQFLNNSFLGCCLNNQSRCIRSVNCQKIPSAGFISVMNTVIKTGLETKNISHI